MPRITTPRPAVSLCFLLATLWSGLALAQATTCSSTAWINEIHYDNAGGDVNERIEIAGPAGLDLSTYALVLYNGSNGTAYRTDALTGAIIDDEGNGGGAISVTYPANGIQNGAPDGIALVDGATVIQFLSYEGSFTATNGPAQGLTSTDIGVSEPSTSPIGQSLQLVGTGCSYGDFTWTGPVAESRAALNAGQTYMAAPACVALTDGGQIAGDESVCPADVPGAIASVSTPSVAVDYQWFASATPGYAGPGDPNFVAIPGATSADYTPTAPITATTYYVRVATPTGCDPTFSAASNEVTKTLLAAPAAAIASSSSSGGAQGTATQVTTCLAETVSATATTDPGVSYEWDFGPAASPRFVVGASASGIAYSALGSYTATLTATSANGCTATADLTVDVQAACPPPTNNQPPSAGTPRVGVQLPTQGGAACPGTVTVLAPGGAPLAVGDQLAVDDVLTINGIGVPVPTTAEVSDDFTPAGALIVNVVDLQIAAAPCTSTVAVTYTVEDAQGLQSAPRTDDVVIIDNTPPVFPAAIPAIPPVSVATISGFGPGFAAAFSGPCPDDVDAALLAAAFEADLQANGAATAGLAATDNCTAVTYSVTASVAAGSSACQTDVELTIGATDACGNAAGPVTATVPIISNAPATIAATPIVALNTSGGTCLDPLGAIAIGDAFPLGGTITIAGQSVALPAAADVNGCFDPATATLTVTGAASSVGADPCVTSLSVDFAFDDGCPIPPTPATYTLNVDLTDDVAPVVVAPADVTRDCSQRTDPAATGMATATDDCAPPAPQPLVASGPVFINEIHYDNTGADVGEGVEVAGPAGTDLSAYTLQPYNGNGGTPYAATPLSGTIPDEGAGYGAVFFPISGLQNGAPDGVALCDGAGVVEFLSYEGAFAAGSGCAGGVTSTDIGVSETSGTPAGQSLQRVGTGVNGADFTWTGPAAASYGTLNAGQTISMPGGGGGGGGGTGTGGPVATTFSDVIIPGNCPDDFVIERTFSATDACGNVGTAVQRITVTDDVAPAINVAAGSLDLSVGQADVAAFSTGPCANDLDLTALASAVAADLNALTPSPLLAAFPLAGDNCSLADYAVAAQFGAGSDACEALVALEITVADECGNVSAPFAATLTVVGSGTATLPMPAPVQLLTSAGAVCLDPLGAVVPGASFAPGAAVTVAGVGVPLPTLAEIGGCVGAMPTFTVTGVASSVGADPCVTSLSVDFDFDADCSGAAAQPFTLEVELTDDTAPVLVAPPNVVLSCEQDPLDPALTGTAAATDNCAPQTNAPLLASGPVFINEFHYDNPGADVGEFVEVAGPAGTDLSGYTLEFVNGNGGGVYRTLALSGVIDDEGSGFGALSFALPANGLQNGAPDGIALCGPAGVLEFLSYEGAFAATGGCAAGLQSTDVGVDEGGGSGAAIGLSLQRIGSGSTGAQFVFTGPTAESPGDLNANQTFTTGGGGGGPTGGPIASTFVDVTVPGACAGEFTIQRTFSASDACGNTATALQIITVRDTTPPVFAEAPGALDQAITTSQLDAAGLGSCAAAIDLQAFTLGANFALLFGQPDYLGIVGFPSASDDCSAVNLTVASTAIGAVAGSGPCSVELLVTFAATDACGNAAEYVATVTVTDDEAPVVRPGFELAVTLACELPNDTTATGFPVFDDNCGSSLPAADAVWINEFHYDNAGADVNEFVEVAGTAGLDLAGYSLVLYNGNGGGAYSTTPLSGVLPDEGNGGGAIAFAYPSNGLQNGSPDGIALVAPGGAVVEFLSYEGTFTASNGPAAGLTSTGVGVAENSGTAATESLQRVGAGASGDAFSFVGPAAASSGALNAGQTYLSPQTVTVSFSESVAPDPNCPNGATITRTFTADDGCGNTTELVQVITVIDTVAPTYTLFQADTTIECSTLTGLPDLVTVGAIADALPFPLVVDNCATGLTPTFTDAFDDTRACPTVGTFTRTFDPVDDGCGNVLPGRTLTITIVDTLAPVISGQAIGGDYDCTVGLPPLGQVSVEDCDLNTVFTEIDEDDLDGALGLGIPGQGGVVRVVTRTYTATDGCGLTASESVVLRVLDGEAPTLVSCPDDIGPLVARPDDRVAVTYPLPVFTDNCAFTVTANRASGSDFPVGVTTVVVTATDEGGNATVCSFEVEVVKALNLTCTEGFVSVEPGERNAADINWPYAETVCDRCPDPGEDIPGLEYLGYFRGHFYYVTAPGTTPGSNSQQLAQYGARLAVIDDDAENRFLQRELDVPAATIGLRRPGGPDSWLWAGSANATDYRNWAPGFPVPDPDADRALIRAADGEHVNVAPDGQPLLYEMPCVNFEAIGYAADSTYAQGLHCVIFAAEDRCGNRDTCHYTFTVNTFPVDYCAPLDASGLPGAFAGVEEVYITGVEVGAFAKTFGAGDSYYNLRDTVRLIEGDDTPFGFAAETSGAEEDTFAAYWRIWIDADGDGDFYDAGERVYEGFGGAALSDVFVLEPVLAALSPTRMRVAVSRYDYPEPCGLDPFGDVKDFTVVNDRVQRPPLALRGVFTPGATVLTTTVTETPDIEEIMLLHGPDPTRLGKLEWWDALYRDGLEHDYVRSAPDPAPTTYYQAVALDGAGGLVLRSNVVRVDVPLRRGPAKTSPNPASNHVTVTLPGAPADRDGEVILQDVTGRYVLSRIWPAGQERVDVDLPALPTGTYLLRVEHEGEVPVVERIVVDQRRGRGTLRP